MWLTLLAVGASAQPVLNEINVSPSPVWGDANCDLHINLQDVFVEIVNAGDAAVDLSSWTLSNGTGERHVFAAGTVLESGEALVVYDSGTPNGPAPWGWCVGAEAVTASTGGLGLVPTGDSVVLADDQGAQVDTVSWGAEGAAGRALVRAPEYPVPLDVEPGALAVHDCAVGATGPFSPGTRANGAAFTDPPALDDPGCAPVDTDADQLDDDVEAAVGTDPAVGDTDGDGVPDGLEVKFGIDPLNPDTDGDGLSDGDEKRAGTDAHREDSDNDGLTDGEEVITHHTDPKSPDSDGDGLRDAEELFEHDTDPVVADTDGDGLDDGAEIDKGTNPAVSDTDGGGVNDGDEVTNGTDPLNPADDLLGSNPTGPGGDEHPDEDVITRGQCGCSAAGSDPRGLTAIALLLGLAMRRSRRTSR